MFAAIDPAHALSSRVCSILIIEREMNLVANSFFGGYWLAGLSLGRDGEREPSNEN